MLRYYHIVRTLCTTFTMFQFRFFCSVLLLFFCTDKNTLHPPQCRWKWRKMPIPTTCRTSRENCGTPNLSPDNISPSVPPLYFPFCLVHLDFPDCPRNTLLPFYQPDPPKKIYTRKLIPEWLIIHPNHINTNVAAPDLEFLYFSSLCPALVLTNISSEGNPTSLLLSHLSPPKKISPSEPYFYLNPDQSIPRSTIIGFLY